MVNNASSQVSIALFVMMSCGLAALSISVILYLLQLPMDGYFFLFGMIGTLASGAISALRREGGAKMEDAITLLAGVAFFAWIAWRTLSK